MIIARDIPATWAPTLDGEPIRNIDEHNAYWDFILSEQRRRIFNMDKIVNRMKLWMMF